MIDFIEGTVADKGAGQVVISAGGVGFLLACSNSTAASAPSTGEKWKCYTVLNVREDAMELFGFASRQERQMFRRLCMVSGVGAKTALAILSTLPLKNLSLAIATEDVSSISRGPGVGKKTAQRIVLDLKDKMEERDFAGTAAAPAARPAGNLEAEAQQALQALGYTPAEAARALSQVAGQAGDVGQLVTLALRTMASM